MRSLSLPWLFLPGGLFLFGALAACTGSATPQTADAGGKAAAAVETRAVPAQGTEADAKLQAVLEADAASAAAPAVVPFERPKREPPDGKWRVDEQGREYYILPAPRIEGQYMWLNEEHTRVRLPYGLTAYVDSYDDKNFYIKIFRPLEDPREVPGQVSAEEKARVAASYRAEVRPSDRLRFVPFANGLPTEGQWRNGFDVADVNGDGHVDIVHGPPRKSGSRPWIFLGDGKGNWRPWSEARFPAVPFDYGDAAVADFNGDGKADVALSSHLRGIAVTVGDGNGKFSLWSEGIEFGPRPDGSLPFSSRALEVHDWNRDGRTDLIAVGEGPHLAMARGTPRENPTQGTHGVAVFLNQGDGTWVGRELEGEHLFGDAVAVGDIDGDGRADLATAASIMGYRQILSLGKEDGGAQPVELESVRPGGVVRSVAVADFDRDGRDDLAVGYTANELGTWRSGVDLLSMRPDGTWQRRTLDNEEKMLAIPALDAGDVDGDGALDLAGVDGEGRVWLFLGDGKGGFKREATPEASSGDPGCAGYFVRLADVDGDGADELLAGFAGEGLSPMTAQMLCPSQGSLRAWKAVRAKK